MPSRTGEDALLRRRERDKLYRRARRGVVLLDGHDPSWWRRVDLETLDMTDGGWCVLGQVFGSAPRGADWLRKLDQQHRYDLELFNWCIPFGFDVRLEESYELLTDVWRGEIRRKRT
jgi:hypothetical protein